jgi:alkylation response protein AidB-like acyl-CoA dehydrogenase
MNNGANTQQLQEEVREFALKEIVPYSDTYDRSDDPPPFPREIYRKMGEQGYLGFTIPKKYGGLGENFFDFTTVVEELCYHDLSFGFLAVMPMLFTDPILRAGTEEQKQAFVPQSANGKSICAFAITEPHAGSDAASLATVAEEDGDEYLLRGEKTLITSGDAADLAIVFCKINGESRVSALVLNTDQPGWEARGLEYKMGLRAATTAYVRLNDARAKKANLIGVQGKGFGYAMIALDGARVYNGAEAVGIGRRALDESIAYAKQRQAFGQPIAKLQAIQWMIADMSTRLEAARLLVKKAAELKDAGKPYSVAASQAKLCATQAAHFCVDRAMQIHAGYGYIGEFSVIEKLYRDQRFLEIGEGTSEIQRLVIASKLLS